MVGGVRITPLEINPQNSLLNVRPLNDAFQNMRKANEFDAQQEFRYNELDTREADMEHRRRNDDARLGLERQRVGISERTAGRNEEDRVAQIYGNMAATIDAMPEGTERATAWAKLVGSSPRMPEMLTRYGQSPTDHVNGPRFLMAQTMDAVSLRQMAQLRAQQGPQGGNDPQRTGDGYRINENGEIERAEVADDRAFLQPTAMRFPAGPDAPHIAGPREVIQAQSSQSLNPDTTAVPGITLNRPLANDRAVDNSGGARELDTQALWPRIRARDQTLTIDEINRAWAAKFGRHARPGFLYNIRGQETPNTPEQAGGTTTQRAARAAVQESIVAVADARERIEQTGFLERMWGHATDTGEYATTLPVIETAAASVMHGLSGAQVNIPETNRWINTFKPSPLDRPGRIAFKLSHLQGMLMAINRQQGGQWTEEDKLKLRNMMRKGIGLREIDMDAHMRTLNQAQQAEIPGDQPPARRTGAPNAGGGNRYQGLSDEELLRQLQGR